MPGYDPLFSMDFDFGQLPLDLQNNFDGDYGICSQFSGLQGAGDGFVDPKKLTAAFDVDAMCDADPATPLSTNCSPESCSDTSSGRGSISTSSSKSRPTSEDVVMSDESNIQQQFRYSDFVKLDGTDETEEKVPVPRQEALAPVLNMGSDMAQASHADVEEQVLKTKERQVAKSSRSRVSAPRGQKRRQMHRASEAGLKPKAGSDEFPSFAPLVQRQQQQQHSKQILIRGQHGNLAFHSGTQLQRDLQPILNAPWTLPDAAHPMLPLGQPPPSLLPILSSCHAGLPGRFQFRLRVEGLKAKSRVETQMEVYLHISPPPGPTVGVTKLHLPRHTVGKPKQLAKPIPKRSSDMWELHTSLVCATPLLQKPELKQRVLERARQQAYEEASRPQHMVDLPPVEKRDQTGQNGEEVRICARCIAREVKRAGRKKQKRRNENDERMWQQYQTRRVIIINSPEVRELEPLPTNSPESVLGMQTRITCYCRHHRETNGFHIIYTMTDCVGQVMAQELSPMVMITDDHKTPPGQPVSDSQSTIEPSPRQSIEVDAVPSGASSPMFVSLGRLDTNMAGGSETAATATNASGSQPRTSTSPTPPLSVRAPFHQPSLSGLAAAPRTKRRRGSQPRIPTDLAMTPVMAPQATQSSGQSGPFATAGGATPFGSFAAPGVAGFTPPSPGPPQYDFGASPNAQSAGMTATSMGPTKPIDGMPQCVETPPLFSTPGYPSRSPSRASSLGTGISNGMVNSNRFWSSNVNSDVAIGEVMRGAAMLGVSAALPQQYHFMPVGPMSVTGESSSPAATPPTSALPYVSRLLPSRGSIAGGIEVGVVGGNFLAGMEVYFGDLRAKVTQHYGGGEVMVCVLPPAAQAGPVRVTIRAPGPQTSEQAVRQSGFFEYFDDTEVHLMRLALEVLGGKMSGSMNDARDVAKRILGRDGLRDADPSVGQSQSQNQSQNQNHHHHHHHILLQLHHSQRSAMQKLLCSSDRSVMETQILKLLELVKLGEGLPRTLLHHTNSFGQTMLQLACSMGMQLLVAELLVLGANPNMSDKGGYTALHMAALTDQIDLVRLLLSKGAKPSRRTTSDLSPASVARAVHASKALIQTLDSAEKSAGRRSSSSTSLHAMRTSSTHSLSSLQSELGPGANKQPAMTARPGYLLDKWMGDVTLSDESNAADDERGSDSGSPNDEGRYDGPNRSELNLRRRRARTAPMKPAARDDYSSSNQAANNNDDDGGAPDRSPSMAAATLTSFAEHLTAQWQQVQQLHQQWQQVQHLHQQFQQLFQQSFARHMPNMPNFPQFQMPNMALPDYQSLQRFMRSSMMPSTMLPNAGLAGPGPAAVVDSAESHAGSEPLPLYEDLYPNGRSPTAFEWKQTAVIQAAADYAADHKCAALYDQASVAGADAVTSITAASTSTETKKPLPALLHVGRKNEMTMEQQENLRRAHAEKIQNMRRDRNLVLIWYPLLVIVVIGSIWCSFRGLFSGLVQIANFRDSLASLRQEGLHQ